MKGKKLVTIVSVLVVAVALLGFGSLFLTSAANTDYYTQIDNSAIRTQHSSGGVIDPTGGLAYAYDLPAYNKDGREKDISFGMSRQLREGAFLHLTVNPIRGVLAWEEVEYSALPEAVRSHYTAPAEG